MEQCDGHYWWRPCHHSTNIADLVDSTGATTGISVDLSYISGMSASTSGADWGGPYPAVVSGMPATAISDSFFINTSGEMTAVFSGLTSFATYDFLFYGARGNNGTAVDYEIAAGNGTFKATISNTFQNSTEAPVVTDLTADVNGEITIVADTNSLAGGAINVLQLTANPVAKLTLEVDTTTGAARILNDTNTTFEMNYYEIISPGMALNEDVWISFADQDLEGSGPPSGTGDGWEELGTPNSESISEAFLLGSSVFGNGDEEWIGNPLDTSVFGIGNDGDLVFKVGLTDDSLLDGKVVYVSSPVLPGDFDIDGDRDGADFLKWQRDGLSASELADWQAGYGVPIADVSAASSAVPEPTCSLLVGVYALTSSGLRRRSLSRVKRRVKNKVNRGQVPFLTLQRVVDQKMNLSPFSLLFAVTILCLGSFAQSAPTERPLVLGHSVGLFKIGPLLAQDDFQSLKNWVVQVEQRSGFESA